MATEPGNHNQTKSPECGLHNFILADSSQKSKANRMVCHLCGEDVQKNGKTRDGQQRYRCRDCSKTFSEPKPLAGKTTPIKKATVALNMLLEGMSVRATSRLTGLDKNTILRLMTQAGDQCDALMAERVWKRPFREIQIDEQWSFCYAKERTCQAKGFGPEAGDAYVYTAICRNSKFLICFLLGKRSSDDTWKFIERLHHCVSGRPQITTDGYKPYIQAIPLTWDHDCDYARLIKKYGSPPAEDQRRYSPANIIGVIQKAICGKPDESRITTSHIERHNLTNRMHNRRFTRLTNAFSKKWENHDAMFALYAAWYNWCRPHMTIKTTPAVAAGLAKEPWTLERLLKESASIAIG